jgi:hypothetical protein
MREQTMRVWLGALLVASHLLVILLCVVLYFWRGLLFEEMSTCIAVFGPMFAVYGTAAVKELLRSRGSRRVSKRTVTRSRALVVLGFPCAFTLLIVALLLAKATNVGFTTFEEFKTTLTFIQSGAGVYVGLIVSSLFEVEPAVQGERGAAAEK